MLDIKIVYAQSAQHQRVYSLCVPSGCTLQKALELCDVLKEYPEIQFECENTQLNYGVGIWSKAAQLSDVLKAGDRLEIYRPLHLSAMDARMARKNKTQIS